MGLGPSAPQLPSPQDLRSHCPVIAPRYRILHGLTRLGELGKSFEHPEPLVPLQQGQERALPTAG